MDVSIGELLAIGVAGYAFLRTFSLTRDRLARLDGGYDVLFYSAGLGIVLVAAHQAIREQFDWVDHALSAAGVTLEPSTADQVNLAAFVASVFVIAATLNALFWMPSISRYRTKRFRAAARRRGDLLYVTLETNDLVEVALDSGKSYVGVPCGLPYPLPSDASTHFIQIIPLFSGYRAPPEWSLRLVNYYGGTSVQRLLDRAPGDLPAAERDRRDDLLSIAVREIVTARAFDPEIYNALNRSDVASPEIGPPSDFAERWATFRPAALMRESGFPASLRPGE